MAKKKFTKKHLRDTTTNACDLGNKHAVAIVKHDGEKTWVSGNNLRKMKQFVDKNLRGGVYKDVMFVENIQCRTGLDDALKKFRSHPAYERTMGRYG